MRWFVPARIHRQTLPVTARRCGLCPARAHQLAVLSIAGVDLCAEHLATVRAIQRDAGDPASSCQSRGPCV